MEKRKIYRIVLVIMILLFSAALAAFIYFNLWNQNKTQDGILVKRLEVRLSHEREA